MKNKIYKKENMKYCDSKDYVLNHDFNYGTGVGDNDSVVNKLSLRNKRDLVTYIKWNVLENMIDSKIKGNIVYNMIDEPKTKIIVKTFKELKPKRS